MKIFVRKRHGMTRLIVSLAMMVNMVLPGTVAAQIFASQPTGLPAAGERVNPSEAYTPALIQGVNLYPDNPLLFDFVVDTGDDDLSGAALKEESARLVRYFLAALTVPETDQWVNLSPYERDRIVPDALGVTEMGRDMLAQDYLLKQLTATLLDPDGTAGEQYWQALYAQAAAESGVSAAELDAYNKVWVVPDQALVYEHEHGAFVGGCHLKVMLDQDYQAARAAAQDQAVPATTGVSAQAAQAIRDFIIPAVEREVNHGRNFARLRQVFYSMILATWYKQRLAGGLLGQIYVNQNKVRGVDLLDPETRRRIHDQYVESFKKGVYNYIREDQDPATGSVIPRKYFSGGVMAVQDLDRRPIAAMSPDEYRQKVSSPVSNRGHRLTVTVGLDRPAEEAPLDLAAVSSPMGEGTGRLELTKQQALAFLLGLGDMNRLDLATLPEDQLLTIWGHIYQWLYEQARNPLTRSEMKQPGKFAADLQRDLATLATPQEKTVAALEMIARLTFKIGSENNDRFLLIAASGLFQRMRGEILKNDFDPTRLNEYFLKQAPKEVALLNFGNIALNLAEYFFVQTQQLLVRTAQGFEETVDLLDRSIEGNERLRSRVLEEDPDNQKFLSEILESLATVYTDRLSVAKQRGEKNLALRMGAESVLNDLGKGSSKYILLRAYQTHTLAHEARTAAADFHSGKFGLKKLLKSSTVFSKLGKSQVEKLPRGSDLEFFRAAVERSGDKEQWLSDFEELIGLVETQPVEIRGSALEAHRTDFIDVQLMLGEYDGAEKNLGELVQLDADDVLAARTGTTSAGSGALSGENARIIARQLIDIARTEQEPLNNLFQRLYGRGDLAGVVLNKFLVENLVLRQDIQDLAKALYLAKPSRRLLDLVFMLGGTLEDDEWAGIRKHVLADIEPYVRRLPKKTSTAKQVAIRLTALQGIRTILLSRSPESYMALVKLFNGKVLPDADQEFLQNQVFDLWKIGATVPTLRFLHSLQQDEENEAFRQSLVPESFLAETIALFLEQGVFVNDGLRAHLEQPDDASPTFVFEFYDDFKFAKVDQENVENLIAAFKSLDNRQPIVEIDIHHLNNNEEQRLDPDITAFEALLDRVLEKIFITFESGAYKSQTVSEQQPELNTVLSSPNDPVGGIDFNPGWLTMQIRRDGQGLALPLDQQPAMVTDIPGFVPVILNVQPAPRSLMLNPAP